MEDLGERGKERVSPHMTRFELRLAMLRYPLTNGSADEIRWFRAETDAPKVVRPIAAFRRDELVAETALTAGSLGSATAAAKLNL